MSTRARPSSTSCFHLLLPPRPVLVPGKRPAHPPRPLPCLPALSLSLPCSFPLMAEAAMATPMSYTTATSTPPLRSLSACLSSALTPWSYPPTHAIRGGRKRPKRRRLYLWCPEIAAVNSPAQKPPRARRASLPTPCELLHLPLCSPPPCFSPLARFRRSRELIAAGHDASVILATTARA